MVQLLRTISFSYVLERYKFIIIIKNVFYIKNYMQLICSTTVTAL